MKITKEQADKVIALAAKIARKTLIDPPNNLSLVEAGTAAGEIAVIMQGLADAELVGWKLVPIDSTHEMVAAYLKANTDYWELTDALPNPPWKWRNGTPQEATAVGYRAMLAAAPPAPNAATSPQAAQTEAALREVVRLSEDAGLYAELESKPL